jgi:hypothetical protein
MVKSGQQQIFALKMNTRETDVQSLGRDIEIEVIILLKLSQYQFFQVQSALFRIKRKYFRRFSLQHRACGTEKYISNGRLLNTWWWSKCRLAAVRDILYLGF